MKGSTAAPPTPQDSSSPAVGPQEPYGAALARIAVRSAVWSSLGTYANLLVGFGATLVLTRILGPQVFGFFTMAVFWTTLLNLRPKAGLNFAAVQQPQTDGVLLGTYFALDVLVTMLTLVLSAVAVLVFALVGYEPSVVIAFVFLVAAECSALAVSPLGLALEKELQLSRLTLVSLFAALAAYTVAIFLALSGAGIWSLLAINVVSSLLSLGGIYWLCRRRLPHILHLRWQVSRPLARRLLQQGVATGMSLTGLSAIVTQFDNFLIGTFVGYTTLGFYDRAYRIAHWPNLLLSMIVSRVGFLTFAKVQHDLPRLTHAVRLSLWVLTTLGMPIALFLLFAASDVVDILYGPTWRESATYLRFLIVYSFAWPFVSLAFWLSTALGQARATVALTAFLATTLVVLATPLTLQWSVMGTVLGVCVTMGLAFAASVYYILRQVRLSPVKTFGAPFAALGAAAAVLIVTSGLPAWQDMLPVARLLVTGLTGTGVFAFVLVVLKRAEMTERILYLRRAWRRV